MEHNFSKVENTRGVLGRNYCTAPYTSCQTPRAVSPSLSLHVLVVTTPATDRHCRPLSSPLLCPPLVASYRCALYRHNQRAIGEEITLLPASSSSSSIVFILLRRVVLLRLRPVAVHAAVTDPAVGMPLPLLDQNYCYYRVMIVIIIAMENLIISIASCYYYLVRRPAAVVTVALHRYLPLHLPVRPPVCPPVLPP